MSTVAIIPVKSFALGKQRLSGALDPPTRASLGRALADHVTSSARAAGLTPLIVTADAEVSGWSNLAGFTTIADPGEGLNPAVHTGVQWSTDSGRAWIVIHSDLPLVDAPDLMKLREIIEDGRSAIAPSSDGGTSAIGCPAPIDFAFGVSSFHRHLSMLSNPAVVTRPGLLLDVDSPSDLEAATTHPRGRWIRNLFRGSLTGDSRRNLY